LARAAGNDVKLIETSTSYESYEAGITLNITPHTSQADLLRLDIELTRSDFLETADPKKPPNTRSNEVTTKVTVPDGSTIIPGGLLKLNQNKGGRKVPILGDIPLIGGLFRSINSRDTQSKLYIFVKSEIIRPAGLLAGAADQLRTASERNRQAFERHEQEFQNYESWPGIKSKPVEPAKVLEAR
jgi:general secretion pathway protein D